MSIYLARRVMALAATAAGVAGAVCAFELWALKAAGLNIVKPEGGDAISQIVGQLQANWEWLIMTGIGLALAIVFGLVIFGSQRAPEHVFRIVGGIIGLIVVIPAILK
jgi:hypothetical protein